MTQQIFQWISEGGPTFDPHQQRQNSQEIIEDVVEVRNPDLGDLLSFVQINGYIQSIEKSSKVLAFKPAAAETEESDSMARSRQKDPSKK